MYLIVHIAIACLLGYITQKIAADKGYSGRGYFLLGLLLSVVGLVIAACLVDQWPNADTDGDPSQSGAYFDRLARERARADSAPAWQCPACGQQNSEKLPYCTRCRRDRPAPAPSKEPAAL